jgi:hypothetical protein
LDVPGGVAVVDDGRELLKQIHNNQPLPDLSGSSRGANQNHEGEPMTQTILAFVSNAFWPAVMVFALWNAYRVGMKVYDFFVQERIVKRIEAEHVVRLNDVDKRVGDLEARTRTESNFLAVNPTKKR